MVKLLEQVIVIIGTISVSISLKMIWWWKFLYKPKRKF